MVEPIIQRRWVDHVPFAVAALGVWIVPGAIVATMFENPLVFFVGWWGVVRLLENRHDA